MDWTDKQIKTLIHLVTVEKLLAAEIAERMQVTRNAVIGKVHRLGAKDPKILLAASPMRKKKPLSKNRLRVIKRKTARHALLVQAPPLVPAVKWVPPKSRRGQQITVLNRAYWMCKWPVGRDKKGWTLFCGKPRKDWVQGSNDENASPYCEEHHHRSYQATRAPAKPRPRPHYAK